MELLYMPHFVYMNVGYLDFIKNFIVFTIQNTIRKTCKNNSDIHDSNLWSHIMTNYKINILMQYYFIIFSTLYSSPFSSEINNLTPIMDDWLLAEYCSYENAISKSSNLLIPYQTIDEYIDGLMNIFVNFHLQTPRDYHLSLNEITKTSPFVLKQYKIKQQRTIMRNAIVYAVLNNMYSKPSESVFYDYYANINSSIKTIIENKKEFNTLPTKLQYEIYSIQMILGSIPYMNEAEVRVN